MLRDLRQMDLSAPIECDVCIVGTGPAGWTVAHELEGSGLRVVVVESGGLVADARADELNETVDVGHPLFNGRNRIIGGTSYTWTGRCVALDELDYERRDWVPHSGWPISAHDVAAHLPRAAEHLGAGEVSLDPDATLDPLRAPLDAPGLRHIRWEDTRSVDFGTRVLAGDPAEALVLHHATVTHITADDNISRVTSIEVASGPEHRTTIEAKAVVLAAGGVENARLLLLSDRQRPAGLGNDHDAVGRYFMDHPRDLEVALRFGPDGQDRVRELFGTRPHPDVPPTSKVTFGLGATREEQERHGMVNAAAWYYQLYQDRESPLAALKRLAIGTSENAPRDLRTLARDPLLAARQVSARLSDRDVPWTLSKFGFVVGSEQVPDPDSRVTLGHQRDWLSQPISQVDWRISAQERASQARLARMVAAALPRLGIPAPELANWVAEEQTDTARFQDGCHPMGTTRMSDDPREGVVDRDCQVHGVRGLYVAGSSVFPTGGHANPTLTLVALAVRLAEHLRHELGTSAGQLPEKELDAGDAAPAPLRGKVVAVTGATGFIGRRAVELLAERGSDVVALTRPGSSSAPPTGATARPVDLADAAAVSAALEGVDVLLHTAYDWSDEDWNRRACAALAEACTTTGTRMVHLSSFVVYAGPSEPDLMTEDAPEVDGADGYAAVKRDIDHDLLRRAREDGCPVAILQPTIVYGPRATGWTMEPANQLLNGSVVLPAPGDGVCNAVYVDDVIEAMVLAATRPEAVGQRMLVNGPEPTTWGRFFAAIAEAVGADAPHLEADPPSAGGGAAAKLVASFRDSPQKAVWDLTREPHVGRAVELATRTLPNGVGDRVRGVLHRPYADLPGYVHRPDPGFVASRMWISSERAKETIGYQPAFNFEAGMEPTARWLAQWRRPVAA